MHFDSLGVETVDRTFGLIEHARSYQVPLGCTIPGRWRRSPRDAERAAQMGLCVRVVKGQWPDASAAADPHTGFLDVIDALAGAAASVAVATHEPVLAGAAIRKLQSAGTPCEMELLYGLPSRAVRKVAHDLGVPVRYYVPYGHAWLPYALRQARRDPRILWWVLRDASRNQVSC
jgi:proline dehydrogenase